MYLSFTDFLVSIIGVQHQVIGGQVIKAEKSKKESYGYIVIQSFLHVQLFTKSTFFFQNNIAEKSKKESYRYIVIQNV